MKKLSAGLLMAMLALLIAGTVSFAHTFNVTQLTDNDGQDWTPQVNDSGDVAWIGELGYDVKFYDSSTSTTTQISPGAARDLSLNNAGDMVWSSSDGTDHEIYLYRASTGYVNPLSTNAAEDYYPVIGANGDVAWYSELTEYLDPQQCDETTGECGGGYVTTRSIYLYDASANIFITLSNNASMGDGPDINDSGDVVWTEGAVGQVHKYTASAGTSAVILNEGFNNSKPRINNNGDVVWQGHSGGHEIFLYKNSAGTITRLTNNTVEDIDPAINNNGDVVWVQMGEVICPESDPYCDMPPATDSEIFLYTASTGASAPLTANTTDDSRPRINDEGDVVWESGSDIFRYDAFSAAITQVDGVNISSMPEINNNGDVVWQESVPSTTQVCVEELPGEPPVCYYPTDLEILVSVHDLVEHNPELPPVADAGDDQTVHAGTLVTLDGSNSVDPDEDYPLHYNWILFAKPAGSYAALTGANTVNPSFTADVMGDYKILLIVSDSLGYSSVGDMVIVSTTNTAPVADAGDDQAVIVLNSTIDLVGTTSYDLEGDDLSYSWTITEMPLYSAAFLNDPTSPTPSFVADVQGTYVIELVVSDPWASSAPDTVTVSFENVQPVADAGGNQSVQINDVVFLSGSGSTDANGDDLSYTWSLVSAPAGSFASLSGDATSLASFTADMAGTYVVSLVVNDGFVDSAPDNATITVVVGVDAAIGALNEAVFTINQIAYLAPGSLKNPNLANALTNKIAAAITMIDNGDYQNAIDKITNDIIGKTDGCATGGSPDNNDWITTCTEQDQVYPLLTEAIGHLNSLL